MINNSIIYKFFKDFTNQRKKTNRAVVFSCRPFPNIPKYMDHWWTHFSIISVISLVHFLMLQLLSSPIPSFILITFPGDSRESKFMPMFLLNLAFKFPFGSASKTIPCQFWMWFCAFWSMCLESNHFMSAKKMLIQKLYKWFHIGKNGIHISNFQKIVFFQIQFLLYFTKCNRLPLFKILSDKTNRFLMG